MFIRKKLLKANPSFREKLIYRLSIAQRQIDISGLGGMVDMLPHCLNPEKANTSSS
jgi:hypothetical protein